MPSVSKKQARFMAAAAHNLKFAKKAGIKRSVAKEFNRHDAGTGILKKGIGGAIQRVMGYAPRQGVAGRSVQGALSRLPLRSAPPSNAKGRAFRGRNVGPIKSPIAEADQTLMETGEGLRRSIGRIATGRTLTAKKGGMIKKPIHFQDGRTRYNEGGKVSTAMSALRQLAKQYREALDMDDTEKAIRIKRQIERMKRGSSREADVDAEKVGAEKAATFAKGGKVKRAKALWKTLRNDGIPSYLDAVDTHLKKDPTDEDLAEISKYFKKTPDEVRGSLARRRQYIERATSERFSRYSRMLESGKLTQAEYDALTKKD